MNGTKTAIAADGVIRTVMKRRFQRHLIVGRQNYITLKRRYLRLPKSNVAADGVIGTAMCSRIHRNLIRPDKTRLRPARLLWTGIPSDGCQSCHNFPNHPPLEQGSQGKIGTTVQSPSSRNGCWAVLRIRDVYPGSRIPIFSIPDPGSKRFPDPGSESLSAKELKYFNPSNFCKLSDIWSGMFIPDPDLYFLPIPDPRSRGQKGTGSRSQIRIRYTAVECHDINGISLLGGIVVDKNMALYPK
jgi:hypothetical protein